MSTDVSVEKEDRFAAVLIFVTAFIGVVVNFFIAIYMRQLPSLRNSFGRLLQVQAFGDAVFVSVWALYYAPVLFIDFKYMQNFAIAARFGQICLICYDISIYSHLAISVNRFTSLYFPTHYSAIFTDQCTNILIILVLSVSFCFSFYLIIVSCQMGFSIQRWMLDYMVPPCNTTHVYYAEFVRGLIVISLFAFLNSCTFIKMNFYNRRKQGISGFETVQQMKRRSVEKNFVQQVTLQGVIYVLELVTYFYISVYFPVDVNNLREDMNKWPNFLLTTYAWILVHTLDGYLSSRPVQASASLPFVSSIANVIQNCDILGLLGVVYEFHSVFLNHNQLIFKWFIFSTNTSAHLFGGPLKWIVTLIFNQQFRVVFRNIFIKGKSLPVLSKTSKFISAADIHMSHY